MPVDQKDTCEHCPAWMKHVDHDGKEMLIPQRSVDGQPVTKDGAVQHEKGADGRFLLNGACCLRAPVVLQNGMSCYPTTKSNWFCHDPARYDMLDRISMKQDEELSS
jgi:hypothetical protein